MDNIYKKVNNPNGEFIGVIKNNAWFIPIANDNTDYQEYLEWLSEGNTPEEAE
jgi:hypothetical protein